MFFASAGIGVCGDAECCAVRNFSTAVTSGGNAVQPAFDLPVAPIVFQIAVADCTTGYTVFVGTGFQFAEITVRT